MLRVGVPRAGLAVVLLALGGCAPETPFEGGGPTGGSAAPLVPMLPAAGVGGMAPPVTEVGSGLAGMAALPAGGAESGSAGGSAGSQATGGAGGTIAACTTGALDSDLDGSVDCDDGCPMDLAKTQPELCGCGKAEPATMSAACIDMPALPEEELCVVAPITDQLRDIHGEVYTRYASARGVPILATDSPSDESLRRSCMLVRDLGQRPDILETMLMENIGLVVMGVDETSATSRSSRRGACRTRARAGSAACHAGCARKRTSCAIARWTAGAASRSACTSSRTPCTWASTT